MMLVIGNGKLFTRNDEMPFVENGAVAIEGTKIAAVGETESERPAALATMIAGVTHPTIIAATCCNDNGNACKNEGLPSMLNKSSAESLLPFFRPRSSLLFIL